MRAAWAIGLSTFALSSLYGIGAHAAPEVAAQVAPQLKVDSIEFSGVTIFKQAELEPTLELGLGDRVERAKVVRSAENLQALYRQHGYDEVSIRSRLTRTKGASANEAVLQFEVVEGHPTRVAEIRFTSEAGTAKSTRQYWNRLQRSMQQNIGLNAGDVFNRAKITATRRTLQDLLASEEFIGAKIEDALIEETPTPTALSSLPAARWVRLVIRVDLGDRVTFGFRGNAVFSSSRLSSLIEEQRVLGFSKDYVGAIQLRIEELYRALGYAHVRITPLTFERPARQERHITYMIEEGSRVAIHSIQFDGNSIFSSDELRAQFMSKGSLAIQQGYYVESDVQKAAERAVEWIKSQGYLEAKLVTISANTPSKASHRVDLVIYLYEGDRTTVRNLKLMGSTVFTPEQLRSLLAVNEGAPLNLFAFSEGMEALKAAYRARGYFSIRFTNENTNQIVRYRNENRIADIELQINEGPQYRVSRVVVEGLTDTSQEVVLRDLSFQTGEILGEQEILESEARLRRLGVFSGVTIRTADDPDREGYKLVRVAVQEGTPGIVATGVGYRNDLGFRVFGQLGYANLWGKNHTVSLIGTANRRAEDFKFIEGQLQLSYLWPWFAAKDATLRPTFTYSATQYTRFSAKTLALAATWERRILKRPNLTGILTYNLERINQFDATSEDKFEEQDLSIGSLIPALQLDMRDNPLAPTSGLFAFGSFEWASPWLLSQRKPYPVGYFRLQLRTDYYLPISRDITGYVTLRGGYEQSTEERGQIQQSGGIPSIKTFALGGPSSLRGFKEQQLNLYDYSVGSATYTNLRMQLDLPFAGALRFGPFLDVANLHTDAFSLGTRYGAGVGFHYQTPVGPVNTDWGFNLTPRDGEDTWQFHFSIGVI